MMMLTKHDLLLNIGLIWIEQKNEEYSICAIFFSGWLKINSSQKSMKSFDLKVNITSIFTKILFISIKWIIFEHNFLAYAHNETSESHQNLNFKRKAGYFQHIALKIFKSFLLV